MPVKKEGITPPVSDEDIAEALSAVTRVMVNLRLLNTLPRKVAAQVPNIRRCLLELQSIRPLFERLRERMERQDNRERER